MNPLNQAISGLIHQFSAQEEKMGKSRDTKKDVKKKPSKTIKEKRKEKQEKKKGFGANLDS
jgi:hypothetical protein